MSEKSQKNQKNPSKQNSPNNQDRQNSQNGQNNPKSQNGQNPKDQKVAQNHESATSDLAEKLDQVWQPENEESEEDEGTGRSVKAQMEQRLPNLAQPGSSQKPAKDCDDKTIVDNVSEKPVDEPTKDYADQKTTEPAEEKTSETAENVVSSETSAEETLRYEFDLEADGLKVKNRAHGLKMYNRVSRELLSAIEQASFGKTKLAEVLMAAEADFADYFVLTKAANFADFIHGAELAAGMETAWAEYVGYRYQYTIELRLGVKLHDDVSGNCSVGAVLSGTTKVFPTLSKKSQELFAKQHLTPSSEPCATYSWNDCSIHDAWMDLFSRIKEKSSDPNVLLRLEAEITGLSNNFRLQVGSKWHFESIGGGNLLLSWYMMRSEMLERGYVINLDWSTDLGLCVSVLLPNDRLIEVGVSRAGLSKLSSMLAYHEAELREKRDRSAIVRLMKKLAILAQDELDEVVFGDSRIIWRQRDQAIICNFAPTLHGLQAFVSELIERGADQIGDYVYALRFELEQLGWFQLSEAELSVRFLLPDNYVTDFDKNEHGISDFIRLISANLLRA